MHGGWRRWGLRLKWEKRAPWLFRWVKTLLHFQRYLLPEGMPLLFDTILVLGEGLRSLKLIDCESGGRDLRWKERSRNAGTRRIMDLAVDEDK